MKCINQLTLYITIFIVSLLFSERLGAFENKKRVLVLNAYHQGFHWTDRIMNGIESVLGERDDIELFINYMDTKRRSNHEYFELLRNLYATKYKFVKFDAIISSDDLALDFLLQYRDELFPNTPVIFSGLNQFTPSRIAGHTGYTGIYESYDVAGTINLMLELHSETQSITIISDETRSGNIFKWLVKKSESQFADKVAFNYLHNLAPEALQLALTELPPNSLVLWTIYLRTPSGATLSVQESVKMVSEATPYPTYCVWDVVGFGVVGGKITSPNYQGQAAAEITLRVLQGEAVEDIPVIDSPLKNIFDFKQMQRFNITTEKTPNNSIILNKPSSFYDLYAQYIWIYSIIVILLIVTIAFLITIILLKRKRDQFKGMAMRDQLTGLYNRYYLQEVAGQKLAEIARHKQPLCLLALDLDFFKQINDNHGHLFGDQILQQLAKLLIEKNRTEDIVARTGGEEFVILLDHCDVERAKIKAEVIRQQVAALSPNGIQIKVSIGIAQSDPNGESLVELLDRADNALYQAKKNGRNRVEIDPTFVE